MSAIRRPLSCTLLLIAVGAVFAADDAAPASATAPDLQKLQQELADVTARLDAVEKAQAEEKAKPAASALPAGLAFGAYGEIKFGAQQNPDDNGHWQNGVDGGRVTLLPSYQVNDRLIWKAEIEVEHGGTAFDDDDKLAGSVEIEQCYVDYTVNEHLHWRLPGIDVVPFGYTNLEHEPTLFYSVQRPELANGLIPTTWYEGATSVHGTIYGSVTYQFQVSTSLVDDGGNVRDVSAAKGPNPLGYPAGITGTTDGLGLAHSTVDEYNQETNQLGYALRIAYDVAGVDGLKGSTSLYFTPNVEPRHAYASDANNVKIADLRACALTMADSELRWRPQPTGIELRAEAAGVMFSKPGNLRANNDGDPTDNVGKTMWGVSAEASWHLRPVTDGWEFVPFYRYTREVFQTTGFSGLDQDAPTGAGRVQYHDLGIAALPAPELILKLNYTTVLDGSGHKPHEDSLLGGFGFFF
jgi:hypothetical protein